MWITFSVPRSDACGAKRGKNEMKGVHMVSRSVFDLGLDMFACVLFSFFHVFPFIGWAVLYWFGCLFVC